MITIDPEFKALIPPLDPGEYEQLKANLLADGCRDPLVLWENTLIDGHNRYEICTANNIPFQVVRMAFKDRNEAIFWIIRNQLGRRNLTPGVRGELAMRLRPIIEAQAREKQATSTGGNNPQLLVNLPKAEPINTRKILADIAGVSEKTYDKIETVLERGPEPLKEALRKGDISAHQAFQQVKKEERIAQRPPRPQPTETAFIPTLYQGKAEDLHFLPDNHVDIIITSPPYNLGSDFWPMGGNGATPREQGIGYQDDLAEDDYQAWQAACLNEWYRVAKPGASLFYNHKVRQTDGSISHPITWLTQSNWIVRQEIIWDRGSTHNHAASLFWPHDERIYWLTKGKPTLNRPVNMSTIWRFPFISHTWHPAPFPPPIAKVMPRGDWYSRANHT